MPTLNWIGKEKVVNHHRDVPYRVLDHQYGFTANEGEKNKPSGNTTKVLFKEIIFYFVVRRVVLHFFFFPLRPLKNLLEEVI